MPTTPNQGFPLAQLSDSPVTIGTTTFPALAAAADAKATQMDADQARLDAPNMVKVSCSLGYSYVNDTAGIGMVLDTVEYNRGTPTDLSAYNGIIVNRGLWCFGAEIVLNPTAAAGGNARDVITSISLFTDSSDPFSANTVIRMDLTDVIQTVGWPNLFTPVTWGWPRQYLNGLTFGLVPSDNFRMQVPSLINCDVPYATMWAVQIGDL